ncbi:hypothetical protein BC938DRAFT_474839 [Jimgerdemannia flammicorona]|uniref:Uncharacterized protein n=1 Tax=Jimgerdemannia flammicorona TaxID=994334 RepID=A0A433QS81_9FUNG|nr:hypothetical protein BC938DRAFT_474839 [Jimgerdemannia flammicorona]
MKAFICVDYLSHSWDAEDLVCSYHESKQQAAELRQRLMDNDDKMETERQKRPWRRPLTMSIKEKHRLSVEEYRLQRLENALWRQMARNCTDKLGKANRLINPSEVNCV